MVLVKQRGDPSYESWYFNLVDTTFDACQHGSLFAKTTRLKASPGIFEHLGGRCHGTHEHAKVGVQKLGASWIFNTAAEAENPKLLAQRMVSAVTSKLAPSLLENTKRKFRLQLLEQADKQHKASLQLIPEYKAIMEVDTLPTSYSYKLLSQPWMTGGDYEGMTMETKQRIGVYFSPEEHFDRAIRLKHPTVLNSM